MPFPDRTPDEFGTVAAAVGGLDLDDAKQPRGGSSSPPPPRPRAGAAAAAADDGGAPSPDDPLVVPGAGGLAGPSPPPALPRPPSASSAPPPPPPSDPAARIAELEAQVVRLSATLSHYRAAAAAVQARYQLFSPDIARPTRRVYVGGLPMGTTGDDLAAHVNSLLTLAGGSAGPGPPVTSCTVFPDRAYAFLEFRSVEEASNCMALDGVPFRDGARLRVRRPNNYDPAAALLLGPTTPDPAMDASRLGAVRTTVPDTPHKLFVGGLPCDWDAARVRALLAPYGRLAAFNLVMDRATGNSKGYAFAEYEAPGAADYAIAALAGSVVGGKPLTIKRAVVDAAGVPLGMPLGGGSGGGSSSGGALASAADPGLPPGVARPLP